MLRYPQPTPDKEFPSKEAPIPETPETKDPRIPQQRDLHGAFLEARTVERSAPALADPAEIDTVISSAKQEALRAMFQCLPAQTAGAVQGADKSRLRIYGRRGGGVFVKHGGSFAERRAN